MTINEYLTETMRTAAGFALFIISLIVYLLFLFKKSAWGWIVLYWAVLMVKNAGELVGGF